MNKTILLAVLAAAAMSAQPVLAQQPKPAEKGAQAQPAAPNIAEFDKQVERMHEHLKQMDALMEKIRKTQNPQERQQLLQQYWVAMQDAMGMMHGMWGPGGMGCCMGGPGMGHGMMGGPGMGPGTKGGHGMMGGPGMMGGSGMGWGQMQGYYSNLTPEQQKQRQYMTDQYLRMQQMMMDRMMQHQYWMGQPQPATK